MDLLRTEIRAPKKHRMGKAFFVDFSITNVSDYDIAVLKWNTPFEGLKADIFDIRSEGNYRFQYDGKMVKRGRPTEGAYIRIKSGESLSAKVDITESYFLNSEGEIKISFRRDTLDVIVLDDPEKKKLIGKENFESNSYLIETPSIRTFIEGTLTPKMTLGMEMRKEFRGSPKKKKSRSPKKNLDESTKDPTFVGGTESQKKKVRKAHKKAHTYTKKSLKNLDTDGAANQHYLKWFGKHTTTRYGKVDKNYEKVNLAFSDDTITYDLSGDGCSAGDFAYTYKGTSKIWLCGEFWSTGTAGFNSQFGTIIHEMMHCISNVDDIVYGVSNAKELALKKPDKAVKNADNYEYFSETV